MSDRDEFGAFLVGFIVGGLSGAVVALLFAPQSGEETRALIKDKSIELRDKAQQTAEEALARAEATAAEARARADELTAHGAVDQCHLVPAVDVERSRVPACARRLPPVVRESDRTA